MGGEISYKTHILVGVRPNGVMTVIADWPHVPRQAECRKKSMQHATVRAVRVVHADVSNASRRPWRAASRLWIWEGR